MKISTVSVVVGGYGCNAKCPFCIRNQTPEIDYDPRIKKADMHIGCRLGQQAGATTCLITGKGEPTIYQDYIDKTIEIVAPYFPFVELQTNGIELPELDKSHCLEHWYSLGLRTVCLSTTHYDTKRNRDIYGDKYLSMVEIKRILEKYDLRLRLSVIMYKGGIDSVDKILSMVEAARRLGKMGRKVQLTIRPVAVLDNNSETSKWTKEHLISDEVYKEILCWANDFPTTLTLSHGGMVKDINGQNLCITDCLTTNKSTEEMRQIIIYPDGTISYDWKYESAFLM